MELKLHHRSIMWIFLVSSNRTFMELKSLKDAQTYDTMKGSNRTFMELK